MLHDDNDTRSYYAIDTTAHIHVWFNRQQYNDTMRTYPHIFVHISSHSKEVRHAIAQRQVTVHTTQR